MGMWDLGFGIGDVGLGIWDVPQGKPPRKPLQGSAERQGLSSALGQDPSEGWGCVRAGDGAQGKVIFIS